MRKETTADNLPIVGKTIEETITHHTGMKPCPFCGSKNVQLGGRINEKSNIYVAQVFCRDCMASIHSSDWNRDENARLKVDFEAKKKWNLRNEKT